MMTESDMEKPLPSEVPVLSAPKWTWWPLPRRYLVAILGCWGLINFYLLRLNMSFAIVAMTNNHTVTDDNGTRYEADFDWNSKEQGMILGSFFYGYVTSLIPGGFIAPLIGGAKFANLTMFVTSLLTLLTPVVVNTGGIIPLMVIRIVQGILQGMLFPSMVEVWSHWDPPLERTILYGINYAGLHSGTFVTMAACGLIAEHLGWSWIFYIFGISGLLWCALWTWKVYEDPIEDPNITVEEREYIISSIGPVRRVKFFEAPWKSILTSKPVWAAFMAHIVQGCGFYSLLTQMPSFLNDVSGWRLDKLGLLTAVPYVAVAIVVQTSGLLADYLRSRFKMSTTLVRKVFTSGSYILQMMFLLITCHVIDSPALVLTFLTIAVGSGGFAAYSVNYMDMGPQFASLTWSVGNTLSVLPNMISPSIIGHIVQNKLTSEWMIVFYSVSGILVFGAIFYAALASGERQPWSMNQIETPGEPMQTYASRSEEPEPSDSLLNNKL